MKKIKIQVRAYTRKDGTKVRSYEREIRARDLNRKEEDTAVYTSNELLVDDREVEEFAKEELQKASDAEPEITALLESISKENNGELVGLEFRLKSLESTVRKVKKEAIERGLSLEGVKEEDLNDLLRYTVRYEDGLYSESAIKTIDNLKNKGWEVFKIKNYWVSKGSERYKGVNTNFIKNGIVFELQFHTQGSLSAKQKSHGLYKKFRTVGISVGDKKKYLKLMTDLWKSVKTPKGVTKIKYLRKPKR